MNDRFKFRAWHKEAREMAEVESVYPYQDESTQGGEIFIEGFNCSFYFPEECELMQFTGLKDKNGKLIYEGDIVEAKHKPDREGWYCVYRGIVKYDNKKCQYVINSSHHKVLNENKLIKSALNTDTSFNWFDWFEVIGNVYTDAHLL